MYQPTNALIYPISVNGFFGEFILTSERLYLFLGSKAYCYTRFAHENDIMLCAPQKEGFIRHLLSLSFEQYVSCLADFVRTVDIEREVKNLKAAVLRARRQGAPRIVCRKAYDWLSSAGSFHDLSVNGFERRFHFLNKAELGKCRAYLPNRVEVEMRALYAAFQKQLNDDVKTA